MVRRPLVHRRPCSTKFGFWNVGPGSCAETSCVPCLGHSHTRTNYHQARLSHVRVLTSAHRSSSFAPSTYFTALPTVRQIASDDFTEIHTAETITKHREQYKPTHHLNLKLHLSTHPRPVGPPASLRSDDGVMVMDFGRKAADRDEPRFMIFHLPCKLDERIKERGAAYLRGPTPLFSSTCARDAVLVECLRSICPCSEGRCSRNVCL